MPVTPDNVLTKWGERGYCVTPPSDSDKAKYLSFIDQARQSILSYCRLPLAVASLPDELLYPWVEISYSIMHGGVFQQGSGTVKSVSEGDTSVAFNTDINRAIAPIVDYSSILNRFRSLF